MQIAACPPLEGSALIGAFDPLGVGGMATLSTWMVRLCIFCRYRQSRYRDHGHPHRSGRQPDWPIWPTRGAAVRARRQSMRTWGQFSTSAAAAHIIGSASARTSLGPIRPQRRGVRAGHIRKVLLASASCPFLERGLSSLLLPGSVSMMGCPQLEEEDRPSPPLCRFWRRDPQGQPLCNAYGSFLMSVPTNVGSGIILTLVF